MEAHRMTPPLTVEIVLFKLNPGVDDAAFIRAAQATQPDLEHLPGYVRRELLKGADGQWIDMVHWRSLAEAQQAAAMAMQFPSFQPFVGMIDASTMQLRHLDQQTLFAPR
jgi:hypothetical protein